MVPTHFLDDKTGVNMNRMVIVAGHSCLDITPVIPDVMWCCQEQEPVVYLLMMRFQG